MSATTPCTPCCGSDTQTVNTPGSSGASAVTSTSASFVIPAVGGTVAISVGDTTWMVAGGNVFVSDGASKANFVVTAKNSSTQFTGRFIGFQGDTAASATMSASAIVIPGPGDVTFPYDLDLLTAFTDNSGGTKSDTIAATVARSIITLGPFPMALLVNSQVFEVAVPYAFQVNSVLFRADIAITTAAKAVTLTSRINGSNMTGGVVSVSGTYATGATQAGTSITAANTGTAGQTLEALTSGVTTFIEGYGHIEFSVTNTDLTATIAAIAFKLNQLRTNLRHI